MLPWSLVAGYPGLLLDHTAHRIFCSADGYVLQGARSFEGMDDHQLRDIGLSRCGAMAIHGVRHAVRDADAASDIDPKPRAHGVMVRARMRLSGMRRIRRILAGWRAGVANQWALSIQGDHVRCHINMTRTDID